MKKIIYLLTIALTVNAFGQTRFEANKYFKELAYKKSAEVYHQLYKKGDDSKQVLERLADSYYYNTEVTQAEKWYGELIKKYKDEIAPEYYFRYAQALKSNGNYKESDKIMKEFRILQPSESIIVTSNDVPDYATTYASTIGKKVKLYNLSSNTKYSDFGGFKRGDNFYFASSRPNAATHKKRYKWNDQPFLDIYKAQLSSKEVEGLSTLESNNSQPVNALNTRYHEANVVITKDGQTMYFTRDNFDGRRIGKGKNRTTHLKLYKATLQNNTWGNVVELPFNSDDYSTGHPALSPDEKTLYFVSDMPGGMGSTDIYSVSVNGNTYGAPKNLGKTINTSEREMFPFVNTDNVLYFSSDGHLGLGALDIFESQINSDGTFSNVKNIEAPFNSKLDDFGYYIADDKKQGFISSNREGGKGDDDIYSFSIIEKVTPKPKEECKQTISGFVTDVRTNKKMPNSTVKLVDGAGKVIATKQTNAEGFYSFVDVPCSQKYTIIAEKQDYKSDSEELVVNNDPNKTNKADLELTGLIVGNEIVINPIFFDFDKSNIRPDAARELEHIVTVLNNNPDMVIKVESHTDSRGSKSYNRRLSDRRAKSTRSYIISRGISANRIQSAIGYGEDRLSNRCADGVRCSEEEHQENRVSRFYIVSGGKNVKVNN